MNKKIRHAKQDQHPITPVADNEWIYGILSNQPQLSILPRHYLVKENQHGAHAAYGKQILITVSRKLIIEYGCGFSYSELARREHLTEQNGTGQSKVRQQQQGGGSKGNGKRLRRAARQSE